MAVTELSDDAVTFLFTDIEGSTRLLDRLGDEYGAVLADHQGLLRAAFAAHRGKEIDTQGDAFFVTFPTPADAIAAAIDAQRALAEREWPQGVNVRVRIGMDTGRAAAMAERYTGHAVHRAARVSDAAHGGQILVSDASVEELNDQRDGFRLRDLGRRRLKDITGRVRIYQVEAEGLRRSFPQLRTLDVVYKRRRRIVLALVAVAVAVAAAFAYVVTRPSPITVPANSVAAIGAGNRKVVAPIPVGTQPAAIAYGSGSVWAANVGDKTLSQIDPFTRSVVRTIRLPATPDAVAAEPGAVWVFSGVAGTVTRVDPDVGTVAMATNATGLSGFSGGAIAVGGGAVWTVSSSSTVARIDPGRGRVVATGVAGRNPAGAAYGLGALWVANRSENNVYRFDPRRLAGGGGTVPRCGTTSAARCAFAVGRGPSGIVIGGGYVWVADRDDDAVTRIDPRTSETTTIYVGNGPVAVSYGADALWVANGDDGTVSRIDGGSLKVKSIHVGNSPAGVAVGENLVWVTVDPGSGG
jgi:YVTN family beta-propeller protein